jgi:hypothetical protein
VILGDWVCRSLIYYPTLDNLGGISFLIATPKEGFLYHLPLKRGSAAIRVTTYPLTAPLLSFTFDSLFFHALTETGLESYTSRCLYYALKDTEGFKTLKNVCPKTSNVLNSFFLFITPLNDFSISLDCLNNLVIRINLI